jgi:hypothetical protein
MLSAGRDLSQKEEAVYESAMTVLQLYFLGEQDYEDPLPNISPDIDEDPQGRVPVGGPTE